MSDHTSRRGAALRTVLAAGVTLLLGALAAGPATAAAVAVPAAVPKAVVWVRAAHLVPEVGTMTIRLVPFAGSALSDVPSSGVPEAQADGTTRVLEPAVGYGGVGEYRQIPAGLYAVTVRPVGASTDTAPGHHRHLPRQAEHRRHPRRPRVEDRPADRRHLRRLRRPARR